MQKTEQRAFAAVHEDETILVETTADSEELAADFFDAVCREMRRLGEKSATRAGWRIRPVLIRVEDELETTHDR